MPEAAKGVMPEEASEAREERERRSG